LGAVSEAPEITAHPSEAPGDADALRGYHFKRLLGKPATQAVTFLLMAAAGVAAAILLKNAALAGAAAAVVLVVAIVVVFAIADSRAADSFFETYAAARGMTLMHSGHMRVPEATPLLQKGDDRYAERVLEGPFAEGVEGMLANFTYEESSSGKDGQETNYYRYTIGLTEVPECIPLVPELFVQRKFGPRALEKVEDAFRGSKKRVRFESEAFERKYEVFVSEMQDPNCVHRLFSPSFIVWMAEEAPHKFAFELVGGRLCCYVHGHEEKAAGLDGMRAATAAVATRLREESLE
jgi:hypothetical protein